METIAVVFGILLALWIDDWHQQRQQQATMEQALRAIRGEIATNQHNLREHMAKFKPSADHMLKAPENRNQQPRVCPGRVGWHGLNLPTLLDAAYQTAIATQALANMRFEEAQQVAKIHGAQRSLQHFHDLDGGMLLDHYPETLEQCAGIILEVSRSDAAVDCRILAGAAARQPRRSSSSRQTASGTLTRRPCRADRGKVHMRVLHYFPVLDSPPVRLPNREFRGTLVQAATDSIGSAPWVGRHGWDGDTRQGGIITSCMFATRVGTSRACMVSACAC